MAQVLNIPGDLSGHGVIPGKNRVLINPFLFGVHIAPFFVFDLIRQLCQNVLSLPAVVNRRYPFPELRSRRHEGNALGLIGNFRLQYLDQRNHLAHFVFQGCARHKQQPVCVAAQFAYRLGPSRFAVLDIMCLVHCQH